VLASGKVTLEAASHTILEQHSRLTPAGVEWHYSPNSVGGTVANDRLDLLQGTLDLLVLKALSWGTMHGYGISQMIHQRTDGDIVVVDAALYKALHRLERDKLVASTWGLSDNNRRAKYYRITTQGRARLRADLADWRRYAGAVERLVSATS
jgi:PadR family transcriptional regulator PadR